MHPSVSGGGIPLTPAFIMGTPIIIFIAELATLQLRTDETPNNTNALSKVAMHARLLNDRFQRIKMWKISFA